MRDNTCGKVGPAPDLMCDVFYLYKNYLEATLNYVEAVVEGRDEA